MNHSDQIDVVARFWRSLEERDAAAQGDVAPPPPEQTPPQWSQQSAASGAEAGLGRRRLLQLMGAMVAVPSLAACTRQPEEKIIPFVRAPEQVIPGQPLFYASACHLGGMGRGVLVEAHMGRPTKVEGNPEHPRSLGGTDAFAQAEILSLYDPDRAQVVTHNAAVSSWAAAAAALGQAARRQRATGGAGLRILSGDISSPALIAQIDALMSALPKARWYVHEPAGRQAVYAATRLAFGKPLDMHYRLDRADVVLALDADLLGSAESDPRSLRDFSMARKRGAAGGRMNRLYVIESQMSLTGANADHRVALRPHGIEHVARLLAARLLSGAAQSKVAAGAELPAGLSEATLEAMALDLKAAGKRALVVPGRYQSPAVQALAYAMNEALGSEAVVASAPLLASGRQSVGNLPALVKELEDGAVDTLVILECNAVYTAPGGLLLDKALLKARERVYLGSHFDETAALCQWHIPASHPFESWSDVRAEDGSISLIQPLIEPLFGSKSAHEVLAELTEGRERKGYDIVRGHYRNLLVGPFEPAWRQLLHDGVLAASAEPTMALDTFATDWSAVAWPPPPKTPPASSFSAVLRPDPTVYDGRYANNGWLQELPKPVTKLTWDNAVMLAPADADKLAVKNGDVVELKRGELRLRAAAWVLPGQAPGSFTAHLGYGRERSGKVAEGAGFSAYRLMRESVEHAVAGIAITKTAEHYPLATAQLHHSMEGRDLIRVGTAAAYQAEPKLFEKGGHGPHGGKHLSIYPPWKYRGYAWGMTIDLNACTGCSACVVACQSENNIAVVGKKEVMNGREMHWLRIDRYFEGEPDSPKGRFQPVPCMHCETAPCEAVCPVQATVHSDEGTNDMVYNRCVGTRYCSNNCPYKVRRFNFFPYSVEAIGPLDATAPSVQMAHNPDVTVRTRGVMEKCTYCIQRISHARIESKKEDRRIRDGDVLTACQAACPSQAIQFGDINDQRSRVAQSKRDPRNYGILEELNTKPRTTYLAKLDNPNPALVPAAPTGGDAAKVPHQGH